MERIEDCECLGPDTLIQSKCSVCVGLYQRANSLNNRFDRIMRGEPTWAEHEIDQLVGIVHLSDNIYDQLEDII